MALATAAHYRWSDVASEAVNRSTVRKYVTGEHLTVARLDLKRGGVVPTHSHENEQVTCVLSGMLKFSLGDDDLIVGAGEVLHIPAWLEHGVEVLEDSVVIDVFSPVRQDWLDKTDTYFR